TPPGLNEKKPQVEILEVFLCLGESGDMGRVSFASQEV
ncbi:hypothetical protein AAUPMB_15235, partial [Pasteurella multocida subsp. multocida str. Anand1_buffalo]